VPIRKFVNRAIRSLRRRRNEFLERHILPWPHVFVLWLNNRFGRRRLTDAGSAVVVSVTSYSDRVAKSYLVFESIAQGIVRPSRAILWLDEPLIFANLPPALVRLQKRGLEVRLCENFGSHKKYFPYVSSIEHHEVPLVTGDDDQLYPRNWLRDLVAAIRRKPEHVHCYFAKVVGLSQEGFAPYEMWSKSTSTAARFDQIAIGASGVAYPPKLLDILREAGPGFRECCPKADDVWLHAHAIRAGYKVQQVTKVSTEFLQIPGSQKIALWRENVREGANNWQIRATYLPKDIEIMWNEINHRKSLTDE
jgi:hypothetical protein